MAGKDATKRPNLGDPEHQRKKKNKINAKSRTTRLALKKRLQHFLSPITIGEHDTYTVTEQSAEAWKGTSHEVSSKHHEEIDKAARLPHTNLALKQEIQGLLPRTKFEIVEGLASLASRDPHIRDFKCSLIT